MNNTKATTSNNLDTYFHTRLGDLFDHHSDDYSRCFYGFDALMTWPEWASCRAVVEALVHNAVFPDSPLHQASSATLKSRATEPMVLAVSLYELTRCSEMAGLIKQHVLPILGQAALQKSGNIIGMIFTGQQPSISDIYRECSVKNYIAYPPTELFPHCARITLADPPAWLRASLAKDTLNLGPKLESLPKTRGKLRRMAFEVGLGANDLRPAAPHMLENLAMAVVERLYYVSKSDEGRGYGRCFDPDNGHASCDHPLILAIADLINEQWEDGSTTQQAKARKVLLEHHSEYSFLLWPHLIQGDTEEVGRLAARLQSTLSEHQGWIRGDDRDEPSVDPNVWKRLATLYPNGITPLLEPLPAAVRTTFFRKRYEMCTKGINEKEDSPGAMVRAWIRREPQTFEESIRKILAAGAGSLGFITDTVLGPLGNTLAPEVQNWLLSGQHSSTFRPPHVFSGSSEYLKQRQELEQWQERIQILADFIVQQGLAAGPHLLGEKQTIEILFTTGYALHNEDFPTVESMVAWLVHVDHRNDGRRSWKLHPATWGYPERTAALLASAARLGENAAQAAVEACLSNLSLSNTDKDARIQNLVATCEKFPSLWEAVYKASGTREEDGCGLGRGSCFPYSEKTVEKAAIELLTSNQSVLPDTVRRKLAHLFHQIVLANPYNYSAESAVFVQQFLTANELRELLLRRGPFYRAESDNCRVGLPNIKFWKEYFGELTHRERLAKWLLSNAHRTDYQDLLLWIETFSFETDQRFWPILEEIVEKWKHGSVIALLRRVKGIPETTHTVA